MIQREIRHERGTFPVCLTCSHEPKHVEARGSHSAETFDVMHPTGDRHRLECRCGVQTPWCASLVLALNHWRAHFGAQPVNRKPSTVRPLLRLHRDQA